MKNLLLDGIKKESRFDVRRQNSQLWNGLTVVLWHHTQGWLWHEKHLLLQNRIL